MLINSRIVSKTRLKFNEITMAAAIRWKEQRLPARSDELSSLCGSSQLRREVGGSVEIKSVLQQDIGLFNAGQGDAHHAAGFLRHHARDQLTVDGG